MMSIKFWQILIFELSCQQCKYAGGRFSHQIIVKLDHSNDSHQCPILAADLFWDRKLIAYLYPSLTSHPCLDGFFIFCPIIKKRFHSDHMRPVCIFQEQEQKKLMESFSHRKLALQTLRDQELHKKKMRLLELQIEEKERQKNSGKELLTFI